MTKGKSVKTPPGFSEGAAPAVTPVRNPARGAAASKRAVNLRIAGALIDEAKALGVNLSEVLQSALQARVQGERNAKFAQDNAGALASIDAFFEAHGTLSDHFAAESD